MSDVFISYSRQDKEFVTKLFSALDSRGYEAWVDWEDIEYAEDWWQKICAGIEAADTFIFVITPTSVRSKVCFDEIDHAVKNNKRIVPVLHQEITDPNDLERMHPAISRHNWLPFTEDDIIDRTFSELLETLHRDPDHVRAHTRLLVRAREWERADHNPSLLLRGDDLQVAENWLTLGVNKDPTPTELHATYIATSRTAQRKFQRNMLIGVSIALMVAIGLSILSFFLFRNANTERERADNNASTSQSNADTAVAAERTSIANENAASTNEAKAIENAVVATIAQGEALIQANTAVAAERTSIANENAASTNEAKAIENAAIATIAQGEAIIQANTAVAAKKTSERNADEAQSLALAVSAQQAYDRGNVALALPLALYANRITDPPLPAHQSLASVSYPAPRHSYSLNSSIHDIALLPDEKTALLATLQGIKVWDLEAGETIREFEGHSEPVESIVLNSDATRALSGSRDDTIILWDVETGEIIRRFEGHTGDVTEVAFSSNERQILSGSADGTAILWNAETGDMIWQFAEGGTYNDIMSVAFSPTEQTFLSASINNTITLWDIETGEIIRQFEDHAEDVLVVRWLSDGQQFLSGSGDNSIILWDAETGDVIRRFTRHVSSVQSIVLNADEQKFLSGSNDATIILWNMETGDILRQFKGHTNTVSSLILSSDEQSIISGSWDVTVKVWDMESGDIIHRFNTAGDTVWSVALSSDGQRALSGISGDSDAPLLLWDIASGELLQQFEDHSLGVTRAIFSPDGQIIASGSWDTTVILRNAETGDVLHTLEGHDSYITDLVFGPNGQTILSTSDDKTMIFWDVNTGQQIRQYEEHSNGLLKAIFSADGRTIAASSWAETLILDTETGDVLQKLDGSANGLAFTPNEDKLLGTVGNDVILWDLATGQIIRRFEGHADLVEDATLRSDGLLALSASRDHMVILWDVESGEIIHQLRGHADDVMSVTFSPDGKMALSGSWDGSMILWKIETLDKLIEWTYANRQIRFLNCSERDAFRIEPSCEDDGGRIITNTPYMTWTPSSTPTSTPTVDLTLLTATPTATYTPTLVTATPIPTPTPESFTLDMLAWADIGPSTGYIAEEADDITIDLSDVDNTLRLDFFDGRYENFVVGTTVHWGVGALEDRCGFEFRREDSENFYLIEISRKPQLEFSAQIDGEWQSGILGSGAAIDTEQDAANELMLVAIENMLTVYINGEYVAQFLDDRFLEGDLALEAGTYEGSEESSCQFTDTWVWDLAYGPLPDISAPKEVYDYRGWAYLFQDEYDLAITTFTIAIESDPDRAAHHYFGRGKAYYDFGDIEKAMEDFSQAIELNDSLGLVYLWRAYSYSQLGDHTQAINDYTRGIDVESSLPELYYLRGQSYYNQSEYLLAIEDFTQSIEQEFRPSDSYNWRAWSYYQLGNSQLALENFQQAADLGSNLRSTYQGLGNIYYENGQREEALDSYLRYVDIAGDDANSVVLERIAELQAQLGRSQ